MYKVIIIETHGMSVVEGTHIHVLAVFNTLSPLSDGLVAAYLYVGGVLMQSKKGHFNND